MMEWNNSHKNPPAQGQKVYYFGPNIGLFIGHYHYEDRSVYNYYYDDDGNKVQGKHMELCPHIFTNVIGGTCDACDAPFWYPYDEERAKGWCPIIPEQYTRGLYD